MKLKSACILAGLCTFVGQQPSHSAPVLADLVSRRVLLKIGDKRGTRYIMK